MTINTYNILNTIFSIKYNLEKLGESYCVIFYVGQYLTTHFGLLSIQYLLYAPIYLIFTPNSLSTICLHELSSE